MQNVKPAFGISWDATVQCVRAEGIGYLEGQTYRDGMEQGLTLLKEKQGSKWLADMRAQSVVTVADQQWTIEDWTPRAVKGGIRYSAFVMPKSVIAQMSLKRILTKVGDKELTMGYFDDLEEARAWLNSR
jgi:hypothetical protein